MKILLLSIGTRGDMEPFLAVGQMLSEKGHDIVYAFPEQYCNLIPNECTYYPLSPRLVELIESEEGKVLMGGSGSIIKKLKTIYKLYKEGTEINRILVQQQFDIVQHANPDVIVHHGKCSYPLLWHLQTGKKTILISPVPYFIHYVAGNAHIGFNGNYGKFINTLTYRLANFGLLKTIFDAQKSMQRLPSEFSKKQIKRALSEEKLAYTISPTLFKRPGHWNTNVQVLGYHERNKNTNWQPDQKLIQFLKNNNKILFLTFGSMVGPNPVKTTQTILSILEQLKIPTIINTAAGGLVQLSEYENQPSFYFSDQMPYDWILEKCYAIIHHGGSGTTHSGLKSGCVTMIIPHIFDQYGWNNLIFKSGLGPKGLPINKLTIDKLTPLILDLMHNGSYKLKAKKISDSMKHENYEAELYDFIMN
ncbi:glycosyltransferase [Pontibacter arcticus]|uniref:Glycosyltransferase n=1 Tax=Pontibacter arcticus TaxID=2080288 RepID=A0A364RDE6_9BACT|nr:glycosyltransferase [Pontibacter arcticus]RAU82299.1 glycosyltransferase [Pontibacter arcticus]